MRRVLVVLLILAATISFAADRPVKLWGYGNWFELSPKEWTRSPDMVKTFNDWTMENFGFTWEFAGPVPKGQSWTQALQAYMGANGLPDVIIGPSYWNVEATNAFLQFAKDGKLADLTKYFNDMKNYPVLSDTDKGYLRAYQIGGKMLAIPRSNWHMKASDPFSGGSGGNNTAGSYWTVRYDLMKKYGTPKTMVELTAFLKAIKGEKDLDGNPIVPMNFGFVQDWSTDLDWLLQRSFGAGFNITENGKLMPPWATQEYAKALYWANSAVRDGLVDTLAFSNDRNWLLQRYNRAVYGIGIGQISYRESTLMSSVKKLGKDDPKIPEIIAKQPVMLVPPVSDNPGAMTNIIGGPTMVSKTCPNLDKFMKFVNFLDGPDGLIMFMAGAGFKGKDWEYVDYPKGPIYWQNLNQDPGNRDLNLVFPWGSTINALGAISEPSPSSYYEWMYYNKFVLQQRMANFGIKVGIHNNPPDDATALEWGKEYASQEATLASPIPTWMQFKYVPPQAEISANTTVAQRLNEWIPRLVTAKTQSEYLDLYGQMMQTLCKSADWRSIYGARQTAYEQWLKDMRIDDRKGGKFNHPVREFLDTMGWTGSIY
jgi:hypothetical protein